MRGLVGEWLREVCGVVRMEEKRAYENRGMGW
jgi:hypothetical protein